MIKGGKCKVNAGVRELNAAGLWVLSQQGLR